MENRLSPKQRKLYDERVDSYTVQRVSPRTIVCVLVLKDGWEVYGISACRDSATFDLELGSRYAFLHALNRLQYNLDNPMIVK